VGNPVAAQRCCAVRVEGGAFVVQGATAYASDGGAHILICTRFPTVVKRYC